MNKEYKAMDVANFIVYYANNDLNLEEFSLTPLKLQKILYYVSAEYLKKFGKRLFTEDFQKWQYGPVVKDVYHEFKLFGFHHIVKPKAILERDIGSLGSFTRKDFDATFLLSDTDFMEVAQATIAYYMPWKAFDLVELTHEESAWKDFEHEIMKGVELIYSDNELESARSIIS